MTTVFLIACLAGVAYLVIRLGVAQVKEDIAPDPPPPRASLYFIKPATPLVIDGRLCRTDGEFGGVIDLAPGEHRVETPSHTATCTLKEGALQVIDFSSGEPEFLDPTVGALMVKALLRKAPAEAVLTADDLAASPTPAEALRAAEASLEVI